MLVKSFPARTLGSGKDRKRHTLDTPIEFYCPSLEEVQKHLSNPENLSPDDSKEGKSQLEDFGYPAYSDTFTSWIMESLYVRCRGKAQGAYKVEGDTPETLKVVITGDLPLTLEDLLTTERAGGAFMKQKAAFIAAFTPWIEQKEQEGKSQRWIKALSRPVLSIPARAVTVLEKHVNAFVKSLGEDSAEYNVYLKSLQKAFQAEEEETWDDV